MASERVADMTLEELTRLIDQRIKGVVDSRFQGMFKQGERRSIKEVMDSIDRHRWTPPPGAKSSLELLREDRDR